MRFTLTIDTDNAAFADDETGKVDAYSASPELARILRAAAEQVAAGQLTAEVYGVQEGHTRTLRDHNGNAVGTYRLETDA